MVGYQQVSQQIIFKCDIRCIFAIGVISAANRWALAAGVRGYLDKIDVGQVGKFESQFLSELKSREPAILDSIRTDLEIKPDTEKKLTGFLDNFAKSFT